MSEVYKPRRFGSRWNTDAPVEVLDVFDNPKFCDRYTIYFTFPYAFSVGKGGALQPRPGNYGDTYIQYFGCSENPSHPQGIGQWGESAACDVVTFRYANGHNRMKWLDLPESVRRYVERTIAKDSQKDS